MKKNIYIVKDLVKNEDLFVFTEVSDTRAVRNAITSLGNIVSYKETALFKIGTMDGWKLSNCKNVHIDYETTFKAEEKAVQMKPEDIKPIEQEE